jgi:hypothetical protein
MAAVSPLNFSGATSLPSPTDVAALLDASCLKVCCKLVVPSTLILVRQTLTLHGFVLPADEFPAGYLTAFPSVETLLLIDLGLRQLDPVLLAPLTNLRAMFGRQGIKKNTDFFYLLALVLIQFCRHVVRNRLTNLNFLTDPALAARLQVLRVEGQTLPPAISAAAFSVPRLLNTMYAHVCQFQGLNPSNIRSVLRNLRLTTETLPLHAFAQLPRLTVLGLAGNLLTTVTASLWAHANTTAPLRIIDLQHNELQVLPAGLFDDLAMTLQAVDLHYNHLTVFPLRFFGVQFPALVTWFGGFPLMRHSAI